MATPKKRRSKNNKHTENIENIDLLGKSVTVKVTRGETKYLKGKIRENTDWMVGCYVFEEFNTGELLGVGYDCEVIRINKHISTGNKVSEG